MRVKCTNKLQPFDCLSQAIQKQPLSVKGEELVVSIAKPPNSMRDADRAVGGDWRMGVRGGSMDGRGPIEGRGIGGFGAWDNGAGYNPVYHRRPCGPMGGTRRDRTERDRVDGYTTPYRALLDDRERHSSSWSGVRDRERDGSACWGCSSDGGYGNHSGSGGYNCRGPLGGLGDDNSGGGYGGVQASGLNDSRGPPGMIVGMRHVDWIEPQVQQMLPMGGGIPFLMMPTEFDGGGGVAPQMDRGVRRGFDVGVKPSTGGYGATSSGGTNVAHVFTTTRGYGSNALRGYGGSASVGPRGYSAPVMAGGYEATGQMRPSAGEGRNGKYAGGIRYGY
jgi:hypothetical protein